MPFEQSEKPKSNDCIVKRPRVLDESFKDSVQFTRVFW